jgi:hypothetical protein
MMSSLSRLRNALQQTNSNSVRGLEFDTKAIDCEIMRLRNWIGSHGTVKGPRDVTVTVAALQAFHRDQEFSDLRQARLVCFGCTDPVLPDNARLIEDGQRFPKLLSSVEAYRADPRAFRRCYRGLLYGYFGYNAEKARSAGKQNWMLLRTYLRGRVADTVAPGWSPTWVETLRAKAHLLTDNPAEAYGRTLLVDGDEEFDLTRKALDIHDDSWLVWSVVLGQIEAASKESDRAFQAYLPKLLDLLDRHPLARNAGLTKLLGRYWVCNPALDHPRLRDYAVAQWGTPWLSLNAAKWSLVGEDARAMVAGWLKLALIQRFFSLLAADGTNDTRRLKFWEGYHDSIHTMYFALGNTAYYHNGADFKDIRKKMEDRLLNLQSAGSRDNNAFIMCIGNYVVVEFGLTGNACFIFRRDKLPFRLSGQVNGDASGLKSPDYIERLLHIDTKDGTWERNFQKTISRLTSIQPRQAIASADRPVFGAASASLRRSEPLTGTLHMPSQPNFGQASPTLRSTSNVTPPIQTTLFAERDLDELCRAHKLQVEDLRDRNGNLWVLTGDSSGYISNKLRSWGFAYKSGKGWWCK